MPSASRSPGGVAADRMRCSASARRAASVSGSATWSALACSNSSGWTGGTGAGTAAGGATFGLGGTAPVGTGVAEGTGEGTVDGGVGGTVFAEAAGLAPALHGDDEDAAALLSF